MHVLNKVMMITHSAEQSAILIIFYRSIGGQKVFEVSRGTAWRKRKQAVAVRYLNTHQIRCQAMT